MKLPKPVLIFGLVAILAAYLVAVRAQGSTAWFGYYHDDSLYWTAAQSLAAGEGYRMASVPGKPEQTKYPVLFPWMLSWVWRLTPEFPANLSAALWVVAWSGAAFLGGAWALVRQLGLGDGAALFLTAVCALHPAVIHLGGVLLSDMPFMALAVWTLVAAHFALEREPGEQRTRLWAGALALAVLACLMRSVGVTLLGGMAVAAFWRRRHRLGAAGVALALPLALAPLLFGTGETDTLARSAGYAQTMKFYSSYLAFWKLSIPDWETFGSLLSFNFRELVKTPAVLAFAIPGSGFAGFGWQLAAIALSFTVLKGIWGLAREVSHPAFPVLAAYAAVVLVWNYTLMDRFFAWALPVFLAGAWFEIGRLVEATARIFRTRGPLVDRAVASAVMAAFVALGIYSGYRYMVAAPAAMAAEIERRGEIQDEKRRAYEWIRLHTDPEDRFIASEDASLYLYTGRQALRPMAFSTAAFYRQSEEPLDRDLAKMTDAAEQIGARYWLAAADDYHLESAQEWIQERSSELMEGRPLVFESAGGAVRIYDISAITAAGESAGRGRSKGTGEPATTAVPKGEGKDSGNPSRG